ncbi:MAG: hypothetical protein NTZ56_04095 [Acidobacteria bacterium]|nr:hypothetical protein [Acidobacteriota bacterium]
MDLYKTIRELLDERNRIDSLINRLESMQHQTIAAQARKGPPKRRGRKQMSESERKEVSERMRKYWETRRKGAQLENGHLAAPGELTGT